MTNARSRLVHRLVRQTHTATDERTLYQAYLKLGEDAEPVNIRHLLDLKHARQPLALSDVQSQEDILKTFGAGAMSFGAISAEAQRDIFSCDARDWRALQFR